MDARFVLVSVILAVLVSCIAAQNGIAKLDQVGGISFNKVTVPEVDTDRLSATKVQLQRIKSRQGQFSISAAGPVRVESTEDTELTTKEVLQLSTPAEGDVEFHADDLKVNATSYSAETFEQTTVDSGKNITFEIPDSPFGVSAFLNADLESLKDINIESVDSDISFTAPNGRVAFDTPVMTIGVGDPLEGEGAQIGGNDVRVDASGEFFVNSLSTMSIIGRSEISFTSDVADVDIESTKTISITGGSNVDLDAQGDMVFESLFGEVTLDSATSVQFAGFSTHFKAGTNFTVTTPGDVSFTARGQMKVQDGGAHNTILNSTSVDITGTVVTMKGATKTTLGTKSNLVVAAPLVSILADEGKADGSLGGQEVAFVGKTTFVNANNVYVSKKSAGTALKITANSTDNDIITGNQQLDGDLTLNDGKLSITGDTIVTSSTNGDLELQSRNKLTATIPGNNGFTAKGDITFTGHEDSDYLAGTSSMSFSSPNVSFNAEDGHVNYNAPTISLSSVNSASFTAVSLAQSNSPTQLLSTTGATGSTISISGWNTNLKSGPAKDITMTPAANNNVTFTAVKNKQATISTNVGRDFKHNGNTFTITGGSITWISDDEDSQDDALLQATGASPIKVQSAGALLESYESNILMTTATGDFSTTSRDLFTKTGNELMSAEMGSLRLHAANTHDFESEGKINFQAAKDVISTAPNTTSFTADSQRAALASFVATENIVHTLANDLTVKGGLVAATSVVNNFDVIAQGHVEMSSEQDSSYSAQRTFVFSSPQNQTSAHAGNDLTLTGTTELKFTSGRHLHIVGDSHLHNVVFDAKTDNKLTVTNTSTFEAFNFKADANGDGAQGFSTNTGATMDFSSSQRIDIIAGGDIFVDAPAINIASLNRWDIFGAFSLITDPVPNTAHLDIQACSGDMFIGHSSKLDITTPQDIVVVRDTVCNKTGTDSFPMTVNANNGRLDITSKLTVFRAGLDVNIRGGEVDFQSRRQNHIEGDVRFISANGIYIREFGGEIDVDHGPRVNKLASFNRLDMAAAGGQTFRSRGSETNQVFQDYGILLDTSPTNTGNFEVNVGAGSFLVEAGDGVRIATTTDTDFNRDIGLQDVHLNATKDIIFRTALRGFRMDASSRLDANTEGLVDTGVAFHADTGDIYARSFLAGFIASGFRGTQVLSQLGDIFYNASQSIEHVTGVVDRAQIQYHAPAGDISVKANVNVALQAGTDTLEGDLTMRAHRDITFLSGQTQRFHQTGPTSRLSQNAITLRSLQGDIRVNAGTDIEVFAAGHATFDALVGGQTITADKEIEVISDGGRINIQSAYNTAYEAVDHDLTVQAGGGGGSVTVISDDNQDLIATAGRNIGLRAQESGNFAAFTDVSMVTLANDWSLTNDGNSNFHSGGKIFLQSLGQRVAPSDGIFFTGDEQVLRSEVDTIIDSARFTVGQTSTGSLATDPVLTINAGGDENVEGFIVDSQGDIKHTTAKTSSVEYYGRSFDLDAVGSISMNTNGPVTYNNTGLGPLGAMSIDAFNGDFHLFGGEGAELWAHQNLLGTTFRKMTLQATGNEATDGFEFDAARNMRVDAALSYNVNMRKAETLVRDLDAEAVNSVSITNNDGDRGTLLFDSDFFLRASGHDVLMQTEGTGRIFARTRGPFSDVIIHAQDPAAEPRSDISVHAAETVSFVGSEVDIDGRFSVAIDAPGSGADIMATDLVILHANNTLGVTSIKTFSIDAGDGVPGVANDVLLAIKSSGTFNGIAQGDVQLSTVGTGDMEIKADQNIVISNNVNPVLHKRGNVHVEVGRDIFAETRRDGYVSTDGDLVMNIGGFIDMTGDEGFSITSTEPLANKMFFNSNGGTTRFHARGFATNFKAGDAATASNVRFVAKRNIAWTSDDESHRGISILAGDETTDESDVTLTAAVAGVSLKGNYATTLTAGGTTSVIARSTAGPAVKLTTTHANGDILFTATDDLTFDASSALQINAKHLTGIAVETGLAEGAVVFESRGTGSTAGIQMQATGAAADIKITAADSAVRMASADLTEMLADQIQITPGRGGLFVQASGKEERVQTDVNDRRGVFIEADQTMSWFARADILLRSGGGVVSVSGSEKVNVGSSLTQRVEVDSTNLLRVTSGYKASINAPFAKRDGILLEAPGAGSTVTLATERRDVLFVANDASFSCSAASCKVDLRSGGGGEGKVALVSGGPFKGTIAAKATFNGRQGASFVGRTNMDLSGNSVTLSSGHGVVIQTTSTSGLIDVKVPNTQTINLNAHSIRLHAPGSVVDFQPKGANDANFDAATLIRPQVMRMPDNTNTARPVERFWAAVAQDPAYEFEELNTPGCVNRQLMIDSDPANGFGICVCDHNKWRCFE